jgi:hypothetical protein
MATLAGLGSLRSHGDWGLAPTGGPTVIQDGNEMQWEIPGQLAFQPLVNKQFAIGFTH